MEEVSKLPTLSEIEQNFIEKEIKEKIIQLSKKKNESTKYKTTIDQFKEQAQLKHQSVDKLLENNIKELIELKEKIKETFSDIIDIVVSNMPKAIIAYSEKKAYKSEWEYFWYNDHRQEFTRKINGYFSQYIDSHDSKKYNYKFKFCEVFRELIAEELEKKGIDPNFANKLIKFDHEFTQNKSKKNNLDTCFKIVITTQM